MAGAVALKGYRELATAFAKSDKDTKKGLPLVMRQVAEPIRRDATSLTRTKIRKMDDRWSQMRVGVTRTLVYVAPKQRGIKTRGHDPRRRGAGYMKAPDIGTMMMERGMEPALHRHEADVANAVERALDKLAADFNRGGLL